MNPPFLILQAAPDVLALPGKILVGKPPLVDYKKYDNWFQTILKASKPALVVIDEPGRLFGEGQGFLVSTVSKAGRITFAS